MYTFMYMSRRYSLARARAELPGLVRAVERGTSVEITRRGEPVAALVSIAERDRLRSARPSFGAAFDRFAEKPSARLDARQAHLMLKSVIPI